MESTLKHQPTRFKNIYKEGSSFRVIKSVKGRRVSRSFKKQSQALSFRKSLVTQNND